MIPILLPWHPFSTHSPSFLPLAQRCQVLGKLKFFTDQTISELLTVPGASGGGWSHDPIVTVYNQVRLSVSLLE